MRNPFRRRFSATMIGMETGIETPLTFVRFRTEDEAALWVAQHNLQQIVDELGHPLLRYEVRKLP